MTILNVEDLEKNKKILESLESAEINGVYIKNLKAIPIEMLIYLRKSLQKSYVHIEIKNNDDFFHYIENLEKFNKNKTYFITCSDGIRSSTLCDILRENGIECYWSIQ